MRLGTVVRGPWGVRQVLLALTVIAVVDLALGYLDVPGLVAARRGPDAVERGWPPRPVEAVLDESAHALTALLLLEAGDALGTGLAPWVVAGATLIDLDHVPMEIGLDVVTRGTNRPYSHSLVSVCGVLLLAGFSGARWRRSLLALAFGMGTHLLRDMATGGVPLYWPVLARRETIGYGAYATIMLISGALAVWSGRRMK